MQNYSLPCLLDLTAAPSYPPKSSNAQKRPATTNPKTNPLGTTIRNSSMRVQGSRQQSRAFMQTAGSFSKQPVDLQKDSQTFFCFTEFKTAPRPLKKLYTGPQHESLVKKRDSVKERYQKMYRNSTPADVGESMKENPEDLKGMVLEAEKVFSSTYSVKYFGLKDNQLGIVSKRVPIAYFDEKSYEIMPQKPLFIDKNRDTPGPENQKPRSRTPNMRNSEPGPWRNSVMSSKCEEEMRSSSRAVMVTHQHLKAKERASVTEQIEEVAVSEKHEEEQAENYPEIENVSKVHSVLDNSTVKVPESVPYNQMENVTPYKTGGKHVVTQYMIPRKLQSAKKGDSGRRIKSTSGAQWEVQGHVPEKIQQSIITITQEWENTAKNMEGERSRMWVKVVPEDQKASNTADFERKVMSLEKTKRSLLRNVNVEKAWETKGFQNELDVPARFRTHEVNKVLSDTSKYSYSQLLKTMYTKERPETALIENTQKLEKIISVREERRSHKSSKSFKEAGTPYKAARENPGQYVIKVEYPKENKMLNQFIKIKTNVVNDQLEN